MVPQAATTKAVATSRPNRPTMRCALTQSPFGWSFPLQPPNHQVSLRIASYLRLYIESTVVFGDLPEPDQRLLRHSYQVGQLRVHCGFGLCFFKALLQQCQRLIGLAEVSEC